MVIASPLLFLVLVLVICVVCIQSFQTNAGNVIRGFSPQLRLKSLENDKSIPLPSSDLGKRIFCNIELNGQNIDAVGFDMDFTLAQYKDCFDSLAFEGAKKQLHYTHGYPKEVLDFEYDQKAFRRGIIIDAKNGNFLKLDRNKYVKTVYHGMTEVDSTIRKSFYAQQVPSFTESHFINIDTLFTLTDAHLFACMVDLKDRQSDLITKSYEQIFRDVASSIDICHRDGAIKDSVMKDPDSYIIYDENMVPMLQRLRKAGKKVFLLTNSLWEYTKEVMNFLVHGRGEHKDMDWKELFDVIIVGACKPNFLVDTRLSLFSVNTDEGSLRNLETREHLACVTKETRGQVFQGGCWKDLHRILGISTGNRVMYVGDHMFSDILRSKRTLGWRTCLIIPELEHELAVAESDKKLLDEIWSMRKLQNELDDKIDDLQQAMEAEPEGPKQAELVHQIELAKQEFDKLKASLRALTNEYNSKFNKKWGQLFKAGLHDSRFAKQVMDYACLYTSKASNLVHINPNKPFRPHQELMPHDQVFMDQ